MAILLLPEDEANPCFIGRISSSQEYPQTLFFPLPTPQWQQLQSICILIHVQLLSGSLGLLWVPSHPSSSTFIHAIIHPTMTTSSRINSGVHSLIK